MKRLYIFLILCLASLSMLSQNNEYFYYYKGEKKFLELNPDFIYISTQNQINLDDKLSKGFKIILNNASNQLKRNDNSKGYFWAEIELNGKEKIDIQKYKEIINQINKDKSIEVVSPYFKSKEFEKIGLSKYFYVKLKSLSDTLILKDYSKKLNTIIVEQDNFMPLWFLLSCTKETGKNALEVANNYYESGLFQTAEPDLMTKIDYNCVNDTYFSDQWGLRNVGQYNGTSGIDIKACDAWSLSTGRNVTIAIIDQGVELNHPDLQANLHQLSFDTENSSSPSVIRGNHGTACAGIFGAIRNNNVGISGVAPDCRIMSVSSTVLVNEITSMRLGNGINWAVTHGADVISNSWFNIQSNILDDAITNALSTGRNGLGCIVVFATGNDNTNVRYPANSNPDIIAVGAISPCGQRKSPSSCDGENWGSNYGVQLDLVAPGVLAPTTDRQNDLGYNPSLPIHTNNGGNEVTSDYTNRDYSIWFNGTSAACPHVAGVAALILSVRPDLSGQQVRNVIEQTAQKVGGYSYSTTTGRSNGTWNNEMGYGLVNAYAAVYAIAPRISGPTQTCENSTITFSVVNPPPVGFTWVCSGSLSLVSSSGNSATFSAGFTTGTASVSIKVGDVIVTSKTITIGNASISISGPDFISSGSNGQYAPEAPCLLAGPYTWSLINSNDVLDIQTITTGRPTVSVESKSGGVQGSLAAYSLVVAVGGLEHRKHINGDYGQKFVLYRNGPIIQPDFSIYPSPATDLLTVELTTGETVENTILLSRTANTTIAPYTIQLWNETRGLVRTVEGTERVQQVSLQGLPKGMYFVHLIVGEQTVQRKILWVQ